MEDEVGQDRRGGKGTCNWEDRPLRESMADRQKCCLAIGKRRKYLKIDFYVNISVKLTE